MSSCIPEQSPCRTGSFVASLLRMTANLAFISTRSLGSVPAHSSRTSPSRGAFGNRAPSRSRGRPGRSRHMVTQPSDAPPPGPGTWWRAQGRNKSVITVDVCPRRGSSTGGRGHPQSTGEGRSAYRTCRSLARVGPVIGVDRQKDAVRVGRGTVVVLVPEDDDGVAASKSPSGRIVDRPARVTRNVWSPA